MKPFIPLALFPGEAEDSRISSLFFPHAVDTSYISTVPYRYPSAAFSRAIRALCNLYCFELNPSRRLRAPVGCYPGIDPLMLPLCVELSPWFHAVRTAAWLSRELPEFLLLDYFTRFLPALFFFTFWVPNVCFCFAVLFLVFDLRIPFSTAPTLDVTLWAVSPAMTFSWSNPYLFVRVCSGLFYLCILEKPVESNPDVSHGERFISSSSTSNCP